MNKSFAFMSKPFVTSILMLSISSNAVAQSGGAQQAMQTAVQAGTAIATVQAVSTTTAAAGSAAAAATTAARAAAATVPPAVTAKGLCAGGHLAMCVIAGLAVVQIGMLLLNRSNSKKSAEGLSAGGSGTHSPATGQTADTSAPASGYITNRDGTLNAEAGAAALTNAGYGNLVSDYKSIVSTANASGIKISPDGETVTLPNGKKIASSSLGSAAGMKAAGFGNAEIASVGKFMDDQAKRASATSSKVSSLTNDQGGGGGGGGFGGAGGSGGAGEVGSGGGGYDPYGRMKGAGGKNDKGVAGMSKKLGSDNIGVSGDNIFEMVHRRYDARDKANAFLKN